MQPAWFLAGQVLHMIMLSVNNYILLLLRTVFTLISFPGDDFHISDSLTVRYCTISYCIVCIYENYIE